MLTATDSTIYEGFQLFLREPQAYWLADHWSAVVGLMTVASSAIFVPFVIPAVRNWITNRRITRAEEKAKEEAAADYRHTQLIDTLTAVLGAIREGEKAASDWRSATLVQWERDGQMHQLHIANYQRLVEQQSKTMSRFSGMLDAQASKNFCMFSLTKILHDTLGDIRIAYEDSDDSEVIVRAVQNVIVKRATRLDAWFEKTTLNGHPPLSDFWGKNGARLLMRYVCNDFHCYKQVVMSGALKPLSTREETEWVEHIVSRCTSYFDVWLEDHEKHFELQFTIKSQPFPSLHKPSVGDVEML